jgi:hypothetical protein
MPTTAPKAAHQKPLRIAVQLKDREAIMSQAKSREASSYACNRRFRAGHQKFTRQVSAR